jgi:hypothetical protein
MVNSPFRLLIAPTVVPCKIIFTPGIDSLEAASVILPRTVNGCATRIVDNPRRRRAQNKRRKMITLSFISGRFNVNSQVILSISKINAMSDRNGGLSCNNGG